MSATVIPYPMTQEKAWRFFRNVALRASQNPALLDDPRYQREYQRAHEIFFTLFTGECA